VSFRVCLISTSFPSSVPHLHINIKYCLQTNLNIVSIYGPLLFNITASVQERFKICLSNSAGLNKHVFLYTHILKNNYTAVLLIIKYIFVAYPVTLHSSTVTVHVELSASITLPICKK
jgi:hypothetical protein